MRTFNAKMAVKDMKVTSSGKLVVANFQPAKIEKPAESSQLSTVSAQQQAMASLCLMILNLNEFVYID